MRMSVAVLAIAMFFVPTLAASDHAVNINTAAADALMTLTGIGEVKAQAIIDYRNANGPFAAKEDIQNVSGIGPATYENIKDHISVSGGASPPPASPSPSPSPSSPSPSPSPSPTPSSKQSQPPPPVSAFFVDAGDDRTIVASAEVEFEARAHDGKKDIEERVRFTWNFGDGTTAVGRRASHTFAYPGRYAIVLTASHDSEKATDRFVVTAEEARLVASALPGGGVSIANHGANDVDLSGWRIHSSGTDFYFPPDSLVLAGQAMHIPHSTLGFSAVAGIELRFPSGSAVPQIAVQLVEESPDDASITIARADIQAPPIEENDFDVISDEPDAETEDTQAVLAAQTAAVSQASSTSWKWWGAASLIALLGGSAVVIARRYARKEWDIIEDTSE